MSAFFLFKGQAEYREWDRSSIKRKFFCLNTRRFYLFFMSRFYECVDNRIIEEIDRNAKHDFLVHHAGIGFMRNWKRLDSESE